MPRRSRGAALVWPAALVLLAGSCSFLDPLRQDGLGILISPRDTALYVGAQLRERAFMINSYGDVYPSEHFRFSGLDPVATVEAGGAVGGVAFGRARVVASRSSLADTAWVSIVPPGRIAAVTAGVMVVLRTDGSQMTSVASAPQFDAGAPAWLPADAGLVYQSDLPNGGGTQILVADFATPNPRFLAFGFDPRVARDGAWVYYTKGARDGEIWRVHVDGTGAERVLFNGGDPDPSPDGLQLAFRRHSPIGDGLDLLMRDLASGIERVLVNDGLTPRWAPDGLHVAFFRGDLERVIFVVAADGTGTHQLSATGRRYASRGLDWSPDGQWLLARSDSTLDLIQVATGLTLPLGYSASLSLPTWQW